MPGKYSHSAVLAQYSSQGILDLPNDQQMGYASNTSQRRAASATVPQRPRTTSSAPTVTSRCSTANQSIKSPTESRSSKHYELRLDDPDRRQQRRLILDLDSESDQENVPTRHHVAQAQPRASAPKAQTTARTVSRPSSSPRPVISTQSFTVRSPPPVPPASQFRARGAASEVRRIPQDQAYHRSSSKIQSDAELRDASHFDRQKLNKPGSTTRTSTTWHDDFEEGDWCRIRQDKPLTLHQFLQSLPGEDRGKSEGESIHSRSKDSISIPESVKRPRSVQHESSTSTSSLTSPSTWKKRVSTSPSRNQATSFDSYSEQDKALDELQGLLTLNSRAAMAIQASKPMTITKATNAAPGMLSSTSKRMSSRNTNTNPIAPPMTITSRNSSLSRESSAPIEIPPPAVKKDHAAAERRPVTATARRPQSHSKSHESAVSSGSLPSFISDFGIPRISRSTVASSRGRQSSQSNKPTVTRSRTSSSPSAWSLPKIEQSVSLIPGMFDDGRSSSDDDEREQNELNTLFFPSSSSRFGQISSGRDVMYRDDHDDVDDDAMSDISAACPPDIGRYKYESGDGGPLAQLEQILNEQAIGGAGRGGGVVTVSPVKSWKGKKDAVAGVGSRGNGNDAKKGGGIFQRFRMRGR